jgi:PAS domain S-box-containing protein
MTHDPSAEVAQAVEPQSNESQLVEALRRSNQELQASLALFNAVGNSVPSHLAVLDVTGTVIMSNAVWQACAAKQRPGCAVLPRSAVGVNYLGKVSQHPAKSERAQAGIAAVLDGSIPLFSMDYACGSSNCGGRHQFNMTVTALQIAQGGAVVMHTDITDRWKSERAALRGAEIQRSMLAALAEGVIIHDARGNVIEHNAAAELILGDALTWMRDRKSDRSSWKPVRPDGTAVESAELPLMRVLSTKEPCRHVVIGSPRPDGTITWLLVNAEPVLDTGGRELAFVVVSFADITDQHLAQQQLRKFSLAVEQSPNPTLMTEMQ